MNHNDLDQRLDQAIDALNTEASPAPYEQGDPEMFSLVDTARLAKSLREPAEPDADFAALAVARISADLRQTATTGNGIPPATRQIDAPDDSGSTRIVTSSTSSSPFRGRLELITVASVFILVLAGVVLYQSLLSDDNGSPAIGGSQDANYDLYLLLQNEATRAHELWGIDAATLRQLDGAGPIQPPLWSGIVQSANGSTVATVEYGSRVLPTDPNLDPSEITIVITDGLNGPERARFHPREHVQQPVLSNDGSRLVMQSRVEFDSNGNPVWYVFDTSDGSIIGTVERESRYGHDTMFFGEDITRLYRATVILANPAVLPGHMQIMVYDIARGVEVDRLELTNLPIGIWNPDPGRSAGAQNMLEPAVAISPDARTIAIVHAHDDAITLIDADTLTITESFAYAPGDGSIDHWFQRDLPSDEPQHSFGATVTRAATFGPDGRYLYAYGWGTGMDADLEPLTHSFGLTVIDVDTGETLASAFAGERLIQVAPAPDGHNLYAVQGDQTDDAGQTTLLRLDAHTLDILAERTVDSYPRIIIGLDSQHDDDTRSATETLAPPGEPEDAATDQPSSGLLIYTFDEAQESMRCS